MRRLAIILIMLFYNLYGRLGGCGAQFLTIGGGARAIALGGAYAAYAEGIETIYWNPAGIASIFDLSANFTHTTLFPGSGITYENIGVSIPIPGGSIGISAIALLSGEIRVTTWDFDTGIAGINYSFNNFSLAISYGRRMTDKFNAGLKMKWINQSLTGEKIPGAVLGGKVSTNTPAIDIGGNYNTKVRNIKFGFILQNLGPDIAFSGEGLSYLHIPDTSWKQETDVGAYFKTTPDPLPLTFQFGMSGELISTPTAKLNFTGDIIHLRDQPTTFGLGFEYSLTNRFFMRLGYTRKNNIIVENKFPDVILNGLTGGIGVKTKVKGGREFCIDYAFQFHEFLPLTHRIAIGF